MRYGISYVVPVYNKADWIESVLRQIHRQEGEIPSEYIFIDDGSTDDSLDIIRRYTSGWRNTIIRSQSNHGAANATNHGISLASMQYIKFVDADDLLTDHASIALLRALHQRKACLVYGAISPFRDEGLLDLIGCQYPKDVEIVSNCLAKLIKCVMFNLSQCLVRTDAVRKVGGCDERLVHTQDYSLALRLAYRWPFLRVSNQTAFCPTIMNQRLCDDIPWQLQRVSRATGLFLRDHPNVPIKVRRCAAHRAVGRAWKFARRRAGAKLFSVWHRRYLLNCLGLSSDSVLEIERSCEVFDLFTQGAAPDSMKQ